jgi:hypothetical protein
MTLCRNTYFLLTKISPGLPGLFGFVRPSSARAKVFRFDAEIVHAGLSKLTTGAFLALKRANYR